MSSAGEGLKTYMASIAPKSGVFECTQKTVNINTEQDGANHSTTLNTVTNYKRKRTDAFNGTRHARA